MVLSRWWWLLFVQTTWTAVVQLRPDGDDVACKSLLTACATLSQALLVAGSHSTILVHPGLYSGPGNVQVVLTNVNTTLLSTNGSSTTIFDCGMEGRCFTLRAQAVLVGLSLRNGRLPVTPCTTTIANPISYSEQDCGGSLLIQEASVTLEDVDVHGGAAVAGGGIAVLDGHVTAHRVRVHHCSARQGGGVLSFSSTFVAKGSAFSHNEVRNCGTFVHDEPETLSTVAMGGGVLVYGGSADFYHTNFENNSAIGRGRCDLYFNPESAGGGLAVVGADSVAVHHSLVRANTITSPERGLSGSGTGIGVTNSRAFRMFNTTVTQNILQVLQGWGAGLFVDECRIMQVVGCTFSDNHVFGFFVRGGAMFVEEGDWVLNSTVVTGNSVEFSDAWHVEQCKDVPIVAGGGAHIGYLNMLMNQCVFSNNSVNAHVANGAGVVFFSAAVVVESSEASSNIASGSQSYGGGVFLHGSNITFHQSTIAGNKALAADKSSGGGLYATASSQLVITDSSIMDNHCSTLSSLCVEPKTTTQEPHCGPGQATLRAPCGTVTDGALGNYSNLLACQWIIETPVWGSQILGTLQMLDVEAHSSSDPCRYDALTIYDGGTTLSAIIGMYCGNLDGIICAKGACPRSFTSLGGKLLLVLTSDRSDTGEGFVFSWQSTPVPASRWFSTTPFPVSSVASFGGGLSLTSNAGQLTLRSVVVARNRVFADTPCGGGGLALHAPTLVLNSTLTDNSANSTVGAVGGGALVLGSFVTFTRCGFRTNVALQLPVSGCFVSPVGTWCPSARGGGLCILEGECWLSSSMFFHNEVNSIGVALGGGANVGVLTAMLTARSSAFVRNVALGVVVSGGGVSFEASSMLSDFRCMANVARCPRGVNSCAANGACLFSSSNVFVANASFERNSIDGVGNGGGAAATDGLLEIANGSFFNNTAQMGAGIWLELQAKMKIRHGHLERNTAGVGGAIGLAHHAHLEADSVVFHHNIASRASELFGTGAGVTVAMFNSEASGGMPDGVLLFGKALNVARSDVRWQCPYEGMSVKFQHSPSFVTFSCDFCPEGSYSLGFGSSITPSFCNNCPVGATCEGASVHGPGILAVAGFWGHKTGFNSASFYKCPIGYCCQEGPCALAHCAAGREGVFCGACVDQYSEGVLGRACFPNSECTHFKWMIPVALVLLACVALGLLFLSVWFRVQPRTDPHAECLHENAGAATCLIFFYQYAPLILSGYTSHRLGSTVQAIFGIFGLSFQGGDSELCLVPNMTAVEKLALTYAFPAVLFMWVIAFAAVFHFWQDDILLPRKWKPIVCDAKASIFRVCLFSYATVTRTTMFLVQCVPYEDTWILFLAGNTECYTGWQITVMVVGFPVIISFPILLFRLVHSKGVASQIRNDFGRPYPYWQAVLMAQRLVGAFCATFFQNPLSRAWVVASICSANLGLQLYISPFQRRRVNSLHAFGLICLCIISCWEIAAAVYVDTAAPLYAGPSNVDGALVTCIAAPLVGFVLLQTTSRLLPIALSIFGPVFGLSSQDVVCKANQNIAFGSRTALEHEPDNIGVGSDLMEPELEWKLSHSFESEQRVRLWQELCESEEEDPTVQIC